MPRSTDEEGKDRTQIEAAYRRGWTQAGDETTRLVLQLVDMGFKSVEIRRLMAAYDDYVLQPWRAGGDLAKQEPAPDFQIDVIQKIVARGGYNWIV